MIKNTFNPWHAVSCGEEAPEFVNAIIEIPKGSRAKYELDKDSGLIKLDRVLYSSMFYPSNYGFIPRTYCEDKDPLDILVLCSQDLQSLCLVRAKVIGAMRMLDGGEADDKIIAVAADDMSFNHIEDLSGIPPHLMNEIRNFFEDYKKLENKTVSVENFVNRYRAIKIVEEAMKLYDQTFDEKGEAHALKNT